MSRYIDADALAQQVCVKLCTASNCSNVLKIIHDMPTADVVEVVRCKDCIHYCGYFSENEVLHCGVFDWLSLPYDYCSTGERREDDKERSD